MAIQEAKLNLVPNWLPTILGFGVGSVVAYEIIVAGRFPIILAIPLAIALAIRAFSYLQKYPFVALMVWLSLSPFLVYTPSSASRMVYWVIHRALPLLAVGVILFNHHFLRLHKRPLPKMSLAELAMAGYVIVSLVSILLLHEYPRATAIHFYDRVFSPMCLYLLIRLSVPNEQDMRRLMPVVLFLCVSQSVIGILSWFAADILPSVLINPNKLELRATGSVMSPSVYTSTLIFSGLLVLQTGLNRKPGVMRALYMGAFALCWAGVFLSFSRASWLAGCLVIVSLLCLYTKAMVRFIVVGFAMVVLLLGSGVLDDQIDFAKQRLTSPESQNAALSRLPVAYASLRMLQAKPFFGWGYGNHNRYDFEFQTSVGDYTPTQDHSSHNLYLTILAEQGLIGFLLFLTPVMWWLAHSIRIVWQMPKEGFWSRKLLVLFWLIVLHDVLVKNFDSVQRSFGPGLWWVTLGFIANMVQSHQRDTRWLERVAGRIRGRKND